MRSGGPAGSTDDEPVHLDCAPEVVSIYWVENVAIMAWHRPATAAVVEALHATSQPRRKRYPSGMSFVHIGRVQLSMIDADTRQVFVRVLRELESYAAASAFVTRASGFWASTLRSVATGIVVLARSPIEVRFHERVEEVLEWLPAKHEQMTGIELDLERLQRTLERASRTVDAPTDPSDPVAIG